jgi:hypothetical protein
MEMTILEDLNQYLGDDGLVTPRKDKEPSNNGVAYTGVTAIILRDNNISLEDCTDLFVDVLEDCFLESGLVTRNRSKHTDQEGWDDILFLAAASKVANWNFAKRILEYGKKHFYVFNDIYPGTIWNDRRFEDKLPWWQFWVPRTKKINFSAFLFRHPQFVGHLHYSAGEKPNIFWTVLWQVAILQSILTVKKENQDGWMITWAMIRVGGQENVINKLLSKLYYAKLYKVFPNGFKDLNYLEGNNQHWINRHWKK